MKIPKIQPFVAVVAVLQVTGGIYSACRGEWKMAVANVALGVEAEAELFAAARDCGPDGMLTYVWDSRVRSANPGYCFKRAGWTVHPARPRSADGRKTLLTKAWEMAGL